MRRTTEGHGVLDRLVLRLGMALLMCGALVAGCSDSSDSAKGSTSSVISPTIPVALTVAAASSLTEVMGDLQPVLAEELPGVDVTFSFAASSALVQQVVDGAPLDVIITADTSSLKPLVDQTLVAAPTVVARNRMTILVPVDNPGAVKTLADLARPDVKVALCAAEVPCGKRAKEILDAAGLSVTPVTLEQNVKGVVGKVNAGEVDAGIVYATDAAPAGNAVRSVEIPDADNAVTSYPAAVVTAASNSNAASAFVKFLASEAAQQVFAKRGFLPPG